MGFHPQNMKMIENGGLTGEIMTNGSTGTLVLDKPEWESHNNSSSWQMSHEWGIWTSASNGCSHRDCMSQGVGQA
jgi:hypothetical protein